MLGLSRFFSKNESATFLKVAVTVVATINAITTEIQPLTDEELRAKFNEVHARARASGSTAESDLALVFALVREAARRTLSTTL